MEAGKTALETQGLPDSPGLIWVEDALFLHVGPSERWGRLTQQVSPPDLELHDTETSLPRRGGNRRAGRLKTLAASMFPEAVTGSRRRLTMPLGVVAVICLTSLAVLRLPGGPGATDTVWAEDGSLFYQDTLVKNPVGLLFTPYNGYLHFVPRTLMEFVRFFPVADLAWVLAVTGATVTSALAVFVFVASEGHLRSSLLRAAIAAPVAFTWIAQLELPNNVVNLHWYLLYVAFWAAVWNPIGRGRQILAAVVLFCAVGSDPLSAIYLPLIILRLWTLRGWRGGIPAIGMAAGLLFQGVGIVFFHALTSRATPPVYDPAWAAHGYAAEVVGQAFWAGAEPRRLGWAIIAGFLLLALTRVTKAQWLFAAVALLCSALLYGALTMKGGSIAWRYAAPATFLLLSSVAAVAGPLRVEGGSRRIASHAPAAVLLVLVSVCVVRGYSTGLAVDLRSNSPSWRGEMAKATATCAQPGQESADLGVAPTGWTIRLPCGLVRNQNGFLELGTYQFPTKP
jgi:hypothetical protein